MDLKNNLRKRNYTNNGGITLIALVITIIVLLILAAISISMLSGDNSILSRATQAKNETGTKQIQEKIRLAVAGAIANGNGSITEDLLKAELNKQFGENGYELIDKEDYSWDVKVGEVIENVKKSGAITGGGAGGNNTLVLTATDRATESRAAVIEVSVAAGTPSTEAELQAKSQEELKLMFVAAMKNDGAPWNTWEEILKAQSLGNDTTINDLYTRFNLANRFSSEYDFIIQKEGYKVATFTLNGETITGTSAEFVVTENSSSDTSYTISATQGSNFGSVTANVTKCKVEQYTKIAVTADPGKNSKTVIAKDSQTVEVPAGFYYGDDENVGKVSTGFVISDSVDEKGYSNGNEFVWIPIDYNSTAGTLKVKGTDKEIAKLQDGSSTNYRGVLYDWYSDSTGNTPYSWSSTSTNYREPAYLTASAFGDNSSYNDGVIGTDTLQTEYNNMIASVKKYGGFYVARYEMGKESNYSKIGVMPTSTDVGDENMWYGLYKKAKEYNKSSVTAGMIWGSQYDAMLNFALLNSEHKDKVTANTNGNHTGGKLKTGIWLGSNTTNPETDKINNIFDLEGNMYECTKEATGDDERVYRGGNFGYNITTDSLSIRNYSSPLNTCDYRGSRLGLYINV